MNDITPLHMINKIKKIELELTSNCNAACPGCARTQHLDKLTVNSISLSDIKRLFPTKDYIKHKQFKLCGVLGDPILNKECFEIIEYLSKNEGFCQISTNAGYQNFDWWHKLGELSAETQKVEIHFCIDGHRETNHIYRVNTVFDTIERNMNAYATGGKGNAKATWIYIVFDHNEHELEVAKEHAKLLGFLFATRTGMRNSYHQWVSKIKGRNKITNKIETVEKVITTTGKKEHSKKEKIIQLQKFIEEANNNSMSDSKIRNVVSSIVCKYVHEGEIFISSDLRLWPCCFLWDSYFKNKDDIKEKLNKYPKSWNSLKTHSIEAVMSQQWFSKTLEESWNLKHQMHLNRCILTCAANKAYHNVIKIES